MSENRCLTRFVKRLWLRPMRRACRFAHRATQAEVLEDRTLLATISVSTFEDIIANDGEVSLREAITQANGSGAQDEIVLPAGTYTLTVADDPEDGNLSGDLDLSSDIIIRGAGAGDTVIDGGGDDGVGDRVLHALAGANVEIRGVTLRGGRVGFGAGLNVESGATAEIIDSIVTSNVAASSGGGILSNGTLTVTRSVIDSNTAGFGGGILSRSVLTVSETTISNNTANIGGGGGLMNANENANARVLSSTVSGNSATTGGGIWSLNALLTVVNSTISGNTGTDGTGGILNFSSGAGNSASATVLQSTIVGNIQSSNGAINSGFQNGSTSAVLRIGNSIVVANTGGEGNVFEGDPGSVVSLGNNLSDDDANGLLAAAGDQVSVVVPGVELSLADNGGLTLTHALVHNSTAIDGGNNSMAVDPGPDQLIGGADDSLLAFDQRRAGFNRIIDGTVDIGAVESQKFSLDVDNNQRSDALSDGLLFLRYIAGFKGEDLTSGAVDETSGQRIDPNEIIVWLDQFRETFLDVDGDGQTTVLGDGVLILRFLVNFRGDSLVAGAVNANGTRSTAQQVEAWLGRFLVNTPAASGAVPDAMSGQNSTQSNTPSASQDSAGTTNSPFVWRPQLDEDPEIGFAW